MKSNLDKKYGADWAGPNADKIKTKNVVVTRYGFSRRAQKAGWFGDDVQKSEHRIQLEKHLDAVGLDHATVERLSWTDDEGTLVFLYVTKALAGAESE